METPAIVSQLRSNLWALPTIITSDHKNFIEDFNMYVEPQMLMLAARGETTKDLLITLLNACKQVLNEKFNAYITMKQNSDDDGTAPLTVETLMQYAKLRYNLLVEDETWLTLSAKEKELLALTVTVEELKSKNKRLENKNKGGSKGGVTLDLGVTPQIRRPWNWGLSAQINS